MSKSRMIQVDKFRRHNIKMIMSGKFRNTHIDIDIEEPVPITIGPWYILRRIHKYPIAVYKGNIFQEIIIRTVYPRTPCGCWAVYAFRYKRTWYSSLCDDIYGYLTLELTPKTKTTETKYLMSQI